MKLQLIICLIQCGTNSSRHSSTFYLFEHYQLWMMDSTFTFTFSHLADAFIQSDLQLGVHKAINLEEANIQRKFQ